MNCGTHRNAPSHVLFFAAVAALCSSLGLLAACGDDAQVVARQVRDYIANVETSDGLATGALVEGAPPEPSGGPEANVEIGTGTLLMGGGAAATVSSDVPFAKILITVPGVDGYYEVPLLAATTTVQLAVRLAERVPELAFLIEYALVDEGGHVGPFSGKRVEVRELAQSVVRVGVTWGSSADLDLRVTDPTGAVVDAATPSTETGGTFYGNANADCVRTASNTEVVTFAPGAPEGTYRVEVSVAGACDASNGAFVLVVDQDGSDVVLRPGLLSLSPGTSPFVYTFEYPAEAEPSCGDGACSAESGEDCTTCEADCGPCEPSCGDEICSAEAGEDCTTCEADCGACECTMTGAWSGTFADTLMGASGTIVADLLQEGTAVTGTATMTVTDCPMGSFYCDPANLTDAGVQGTFDGGALELSIGEVYDLTGTVQEDCSQASGDVTALDGLMGGTWTMSPSAN